MKVTRLSAVVGLVGIVVTTLVPSVNSTASARTWAPAGTATIHPGVRVTTPIGACTSNFLFEAAGRIMLGTAAHCATTGSPADIDGCTTPSLSLGTPVTVQGATANGILVYSSWRAMQQVGETSADACMYNDFALVEINPIDLGAVNPTYPDVGGPIGVGSAEFGEKVFSHGRSPLRLGLASEKVGAVIGGAGWWRRIYTVSPGVPGDSGSGALSERGEAAMVITILEAAPRSGSNRAVNLAHVIDYARSHSPAGIDLRGLVLVPGTEPFVPSL